MPSRVESVSVECSKCGEEHRDEFYVPAGQTPLSVANEFVANVLGWTVAEDMTLCAGCSGGKKGGKR